MIFTIKNNIQKDSNPKVGILNQFSIIVDKKIEENVNFKKEKAFYGIFGLFFKGKNGSGEFKAN